MVQKTVYGIYSSIDKIDPSKKRTWQRALSARLTSHDQHVLGALNGAGINSLPQCAMTSSYYLSQLLVAYRM